MNINLFCSHDLSNNDFLTFDDINSLRQTIQVDAAVAHADGAHLHAMQVVDVNGLAFSGNRYQNLGRVAIGRADGQRRRKGCTVTDDERAKRLPSSLSW